MQRGDQRLVDLKQRAPAGEYYEGRRRAVAAPRLAGSLGEIVGADELAAAIAMGADEVGVAEIANRRCAVDLAAGPQIAAGEAAEHGRPSGLHAFALQRVENLLH